MLPPSFGRLGPLLNAAQISILYSVIRFISVAGSKSTEKQGCKSEDVVEYIFSGQLDRYGYGCHLLRLYNTNTIGF